MPTIPASTQTVGGVLDGILAMNVALFGLSQDPTIETWTGTFNGLPVALYEGDPGPYQPEVLIAVGYDGISGTPVTQAVSRPTMGTNRSREIEVAMKCLYSVQVLGGEAGRQTARNALEALTTPVQLYFRYAGQETLGGSCREALVQPDINGPAIRTAFDPSTGLVTGFFAETALTITAFIRN